MSVPAAVTTSPATTGGGTASQLSGTWNGKYSGSYSGTFTLKWVGTGSTLDGTIKLSSLGELPLHGTVVGSTIQFGTVGSTAIQYTGTVSGNSMSGSYKVAAAGASGSWSASKAS